MARTIGGMKESEALQIAYDTAFLDYLKAWPNVNPTQVQCDMVISEYRHSHPTKVIGAASVWLCDRVAWDSSEREDNRRYNATKKAYKVTRRKFGV